MLATMIRNLLDNALRHTPHGGRIDIGVYREDGSAVLQIEDTGPASQPLTWRRYSSRSFAAPARRAKEPASASRS